MGPKMCYGHVVYVSKIAYPNRSCSWSPTEIMLKHYDVMNDAVYFKKLSISVNLALYITCKSQIMISLLMRLKYRMWFLIEQHCFKYSFGTENDTPWSPTLPALSDTIGRVVLNYKLLCRKRVEFNVVLILPKIYWLLIALWTGLCRFILLGAVWKTHRVSIIPNEYCK